MKNLYKLGLTLIISLLSFVSSDVFASHLTGADFQYICMGRGPVNDTILLRLNVFRDCAGINPPNTIDVTIANSCGVGVTNTMTQVAVNGIEVSFLCGPLIGQSTCNGGSQPGMKIYTYEFLYILPSSCSGSLQASATGGTPGFNYSWPMGLTGSDIDLLCAGNYQVTIQDNNGCTITDTTELVDMAGMKLTATVSEISCNGACDGSISVTPTLGTAPFVYNWQDGASGNSRTNLCPGLYSVTVMDDDGSQYAYWVNLENPTPLFTNFIVEDESCASACDGIVRTEVTGGTPPYTYAWSGGLTGNIQANVCPGTYNVTITDANSCSTTSSVTVNAATALNSSFTVNNSILCNGNCNGSVTVSATGGVGPYTFEWDNGFMGTTQTNLCAGTYVVTTTDANGCTSVQNVVLTQPAAILPNPTITNSTCAGTTGSISLSPSGGVGPYSYSWNITPNPGNTNTVTNLQAAAYQVTITDANGCVSTHSFGVSNIGGPTSSGAAITPPSCNGNSNGIITLTPIGGSTPYTYAWSTGQTNDSISNLAAGNYTVTITDNGGCKLVDIITVTDPLAIDVALTSTDPTCNGLCDGTIAITPSGGSGGYNVLWSNGGTGLSQSNLCSGTYSLTVTDGNGCTFAQNNIVLTDPAVLQDSITLNTVINCNGDCNGELQAYPYGGTAPYTYAWNNGTSLQKNYDLCAGLHIVTITDANGCSVVDSFTITQPLPIIPNINQVSGVTCSGLWFGGWGSCCRPAGAVNTNTGNFYSDFQMNQTLPQGDCNSGVEFEDNPNAHPLRYVCLGDTLCYNFGVTESNGDSLVFELIPAKSTATANVVYNTVGTTVYSGTNPIDGITLNPATGEVCFVAQPVGRYVVAIQVSEYDPITGLFKGQNMRDILFIVQACPPNTPPTGTNIVNFDSTGGAQQTGPASIEMCEGDSFCFDVVFHDSDLVDTNMFVFTNLQDWLNGPNPSDTATIVNTVLDTVVINGDSLMEITSTICWTAPPNSGGTYNFYVGVNDDHCQVPKDFFRAITVNVTGSTVAWPDATICGNQSSQIFSAGGTAFSWNAISGDPIQVGVNFSCDSCASPVASPSQTTTYVVTSNINSACQNSDTVTITVAPDYQVIATPDTIMCNVDTIQLNASATIPGTFTYQWNNSASLSNDAIANPVAVPPGSTVYSVTMTSSDGCQKNSTANIIITPPFPLLNPVAIDTALCGNGDSTQLNVEFLHSNTNACGPSYSQCLSTTTATDIGTGTTSNGTTTYPAPFGNFRETAKHQFLYRASELTAMGLSAGMITEIGFDVASINGTTNYNDFTVKMECTSLTSLPATFQAVNTTVFPAANITIALGWNMLVFSTPYIWDGTSSLLVEVCFDNSSSVTTSNSATRFSATPFTSSLYYANNFNNACSAPGAPSPLFQRPNTRFSFCDGADTAAYTYNWSPNVNISDTSIINPFVWPDATQNYQVIVNDTFGVCSDTADITIYVGELEIGNDTLICEGDSVQFNPNVVAICPNGTDTYSWSPTTGLSNPNIANPVATVNQTTNYVLTYTNSCGCTLMDTVTVFVNNMLNPNRVLTHPTCGLADGEILINSVGGSAPFTFSIDSGSTFVSTNNFTALAMGGYHIQVQDSNGCLSPMVTDTLINPGTPIVDSISTVDPSCFGFTDGEITIYATGGTNPLRYSISGGAPFLINNHFTSLAAGTYTIVVRDDSLCETFPQTVNLVSNNQLFLDSIQASNLLCFQDSSGIIEVFGHGGTSPLEYSINNGVSYNPSSLFNGLSAGSYNIIIKDAIGCTTTMQNQVLTEPTLLTATVYPTHDTCFNACGGAANAVVNGGTQPYTYSWKKGVNIIGANSNSVSGLCQGIDYEFTVVDSNNCVQAIPFVITHPDLLVATFTSTNISCYGADDGTLSLSATGGTAPYQYSIDGGSTFSNSPNFSALAPGTYNIVIADSGFRCDATVTAVLTEPSQITISSNITQKQLCITGCTQLVASAVGGVGPPYNFIWNQGLDSNGTQTACPTQTTIYSVYAADTNGCTSDPIGITLTLYDSLTVDAGPDQDLCPEESAQLNAIASGGNGNGLSYQWTPAAGLNNPFIANPSAKPFNSTLYTVKVTDNCETPAAYDSLWVNVHPIPTMGFVAKDTTEGCEPFDITLVNTSAPVQFAEWSIPGTDITAHGFQVDITDLTEGVYDVHLRVITPFGCENEITQTDFITVHPLPIAKFNMNPDQTTIYNTVVQFKDQSIGDIQSWAWDFSSLDSASEQNPTYEFPKEIGTYPITLHVTTTKSCENDITQLLRIGGEYNIFVPNSFTPNGDGQNDVFAPRAVGMDLSKYSLIIYDRWGGIVFESTDLNQPWDGRVQGSTKMAQNGVYVWRIIAHEATDEGEGHIYKGTVNLIR